MRKRNLAVSLIILLGFTLATNAADQFKFESRFIEMNETDLADFSSQYNALGSDKALVERLIYEFCSARNIEVTSAPSLVCKKGDEAGVSIAEDFLFATAFKKVTSKQQEDTFQVANTGSAPFGYELNFKISTSKSDAKAIDLDLKIKRKGIQGYVTAVEDGNIIDIETAMKKHPVKKDVPDPKYTVFESREIPCNVSLYPGQCIKLPATAHEEIQADGKVAKMGTVILLQVERVAKSKS